MNTTATTTQPDAPAAGPAKAARPRKKPQAPATQAPAAADLSPVQRQYLAIKAKHPGFLLLFRMGDFYEAFFDDARTLSAATGATALVRVVPGADPIPMATVSYHAAEKTLRTLIGAGHKVALCEQIDKAPAGAPAREVVRVVEPAAESVAAESPSAGEPADAGPPPPKTPRRATRSERARRDAELSPPLFPDVPPEALPPLPTRRQGMERMNGPRLCEQLAGFAKAAKAAKAGGAGGAEPEGKS